MTSPMNDPRASRAAMEQELLARLGLTRDANTQDIERAHDELVQFLESAPGDLRAWAQREIAAADEAYALLSDPTAEIPVDQVIVATAPAVPEASTAVAAVAAAPVSAAAATDDEEEEILADEPVPTRPVRRKGAPAAATAAAAVTTDAPAPSDGIVIRKGLLMRLGLVAAGLVGVAVLVIAVYNFGGGSSVPGMNGTPAPEASAVAGAGVDQAQVGALMEKLQANPNDTTTLLDLANLYYQGQDFATAGTFFDKVITIDPKNIDALLGRGATAYNVGDRTIAEKDWNAVLAIDPKNVDAHYYLGFMYLDSATPDMAKVKAEWQKVIDIDPTSDVAKTVKQHLDSLASAAPGASTGTSGAGSSAAPSVAPSASTAP
jgi:cytochrome c-type biogenesis protein CcmH/NrfG